MTSEAGSTPDPRSVTPTTSRAPSLTRFDLRATAGGEARKARDRKKRKASLKLIRSEEEEFAESVQRDLADLPTIEEKDRRS